MRPNKIVLIGASTGGPGQIEKIIASLPKLYDTTLIIAQHMAVAFIPSFISRVQKYSANTLLLTNESAILESATIYFCSGRTTVVHSHHNLCFRVKEAKECGYNPDINELFASFVPFVKDIKILAIILTGIGDDGVSGCRDLSIAGANALTQTAQSAIVDGMTSRARNEVPNIEVLNMDQIQNRIKGFCS